MMMKLFFLFALWWSTTATAVDASSSSTTTSIFALSHPLRVAGGTMMGGTNSVAPAAAANAANAADDAAADDAADDDDDVAAFEKVETHQFGAAADAATTKMAFHRRHLDEGVNDDDASVAAANDDAADVADDAVQGDDVYGAYGGNDDAVAAAAAANGAYQAYDDQYVADDYNGGGGGGGGGYDFSYDDTLAYDGSYNAYVRTTNCVSFVTQREGNIQVQLPGSLWYVSQASFLFWEFNNGNSEKTTYMLDVRDALAAFAAASYNEGGDGNNENGQEASSCQPLDNSYDIFGTILEEAAAAAAAAAADDQTNDVDWSAAQFYWGPICRRNSWGLTIGVFVDSDCTLYVPQLSETLDTYRNGGSAGQDDGEDGGNEDGGNQDNDIDLAAIQSINGNYQGDISCANNANLCGRLLESSANTETCDSSMYFVDAPWHWNWGSGRGSYQLSQDDLQDLDASCAAVQSALGGSSLTFEDYLQQMEANGGVLPCKNLVDRAARTWLVLSGTARMAIVGVVVAFSIFVVFVLMSCCIQIRRVRKGERPCRRPFLFRRRRQDTTDDNDLESIPANHSRSILSFQRTKSTAMPNVKEGDENSVATYQSDGSNGSDGSKKRPLLEPCLTKDSDTLTRTKGSLKIIKEWKGLGGKSYDTEEDAKYPDGEITNDSFVSLEYSSMMA